MSSSDRRSLILQHAAALFAQKGISATTVRGIADRVGILSGSLYHYFDSKGDIVKAVVEEYLRELADRYTGVVQTGAGSRDQLRDLVLASLEVVHEHPHASEVYQANRNHFESDDRFAEIRRLAGDIQSTWVAVIESGVRAEEFRADVNPRVFHRFIRDAVFLASRWYHPSESYPITELAEDTARIFLDGFTAEGRRTDPARW